MAQQALILIDIQNDYFPGGPIAMSQQAPFVDAATANARRVLEWFRRNHQPVFHVQHLAIQPGATFFVPDTVGVETHYQVAPLDDEPLIRKHFPNAFRDTSLQKKLADSNVDRLTVCGAMTHMCIDTSVRAAFDLGFACRVVADACATRQLEYGRQAVEAARVQAAFMAALGAAFAEIVTTDDLVGPHA